MTVSRSGFGFGIMDWQEFGFGQICEW